MCQDSSSFDLLNEIRYKILCKLYNRYKLAIKIALDNVNEKPIADAKMNELDSILQEIENYPISWSYYKLQEVQFTSDFESLVIFKDDKYLNIDWSTMSLMLWSMINTVCFSADLSWELSPSLDYDVFILSSFLPLYLYGIRVSFYHITKGDCMLVLSKSILNKLRESKYKVYSKAPLKEGDECFCNSESFKPDEPFCITSVSSKNICHKDGRFYYTNEDLSATADWFPAHVIPICNMFTPCGKNKKQKYVSQVDNKYGKSIKSNKYLIDTNLLPAFNDVNEDISIYEYRFYLTLFNDYTVKQCQYERHNLHDATFKSSKYDLPSKLQNSDFLKSKDFKIINARRAQEESVPVGLIIKEDNSKYSLEYGKVYIDMENKISIVWH